MLNENNIWIDYLINKTILSFLFFFYDIMSLQLVSFRGGE